MTFEKICYRTDVNLGIDKPALTHAAQYLITSAGYRTEICLCIEEPDERELDNSSVMSLHSMAVAIQSGGVLWRYLGYMLKNYMGGEEFASRERSWQQKDNEAKPAQDEVELETVGAFASQDF